MPVPSRTLLAVLAVAATMGQPAMAQTMSEPPLATEASDPSLKWGPCPEIFGAGCEIAVLHGDPGKPNADIFLRIAGGNTLAAHTHTSAERMVLVTGLFEVKYLRAPPAMLLPGSYAFGPAGLPHKAMCLSKAPCTLFIAFEGPVDALAHGGPLD
jgi:hypothetical protein